MSLAVIGLLLCLVAVFLQDWKYRQIHVVLPITVLILSFYIVRQKNDFFFTTSSYNVLFFLTTLGILTLYMSIRNKRFLNPFQNYFGLGDVLFYVAVAPLFLLQSYILFFIFSLIFALVLQVGLKKISKEKTVPLAGFAALFLCIMIVKDLMLNFPKITLV